MVLCRKGISLIALLGVSASGCYKQRTEPTPNADLARCATCHGDANRAGDFLMRSAPPRDLSGGTDPSYPGVGAHLIHLQASSTHGEIACGECHVVPTRVDAPGHADHGAPATLEFGALASTDAHLPRYDASTRTCQNSYCHGATNPVWNAPRSSSAACGSCHGLPPPLPHPQSERCSVCHGEVIDAARHFIAPELHVNGQVESTAGRCSLCHGSGDDAAPPKDTLGNDAISAIGVGAHRAHLSSSIGRSLSCSECHSVPEKVADQDHIQGLPARVRLQGVAAAGKRSPLWQHAEQTCADTYCHSPTPGSANTSPRWTDPAAPSCTSCHGAPPPAPHPQIAQCSLCHGATVGSDDRTIIDRERHIDGVVDVATPESCTACHGSANPAPPRALDGSNLTSSAGVGAHQTHVLGTPRSRAVPCGECHAVPKTVLASGHIDTPSPAEVIFSGAAVAPESTASYSQGTCQNTACHGGQWASGNASGGSHTTPLWTRVDGSEASCGSCHGLPPPAPHPYGSLNPTCSACHADIADDNKTFLRPDLHGDGVVTFAVP
jgi:predicted CxxxxCH...CXXCH cytochrome family protein